MRRTLIIQSCSFRWTTTKESNPPSRSSQSIDIPHEMNQCQSEVMVFCSPMVLFVDSSSNVDRDVPIPLSYVFYWNRRLLSIPIGRFLCNVGRLCYWTGLFNLRCEWSFLLFFLSSILYMSLSPSFSCLFREGRKTRNVQSVVERTPGTIIREGKYLVEDFPFLFGLD